MYIKTISIQGFRSYLEQHFKEDFSPRHNVIVGRNGSGKSNFFAAIQFVLSDKYSTLRAEERKSLLHEGAGRPVMSAYVEIVFDNSDNRLLVDWGPENEVRIRRTIGVKKDEFRVNGKTHTAAEVQQLLESAGFSSSNPYYIVQQGKIQHLAMMKDTERLLLLKEVAGTKVYEDRRVESARMMEESAARRAKIDESIKVLDDRLAELEGEKEELTKFKDLDRSRRSIEYAIYDKDLTAARSHLEELEANRQEDQANLQALTERMLATHKELKETERQLTALDRDNQAAALALQRTTEERQRLERQRAALQLRLTDVHSQRERDGASRGAMEEELKGLRGQITETNKQLERVRHDLGKAKYTEASTRDKLTKASARLAELHAKKGRAAEFRTQAERDKYLADELKANEAALRNARKQMDGLQAEMRSLEEKAKASGGQRRQREKQVQDLAGEILAADRKKEEVTQRRDELGATRRQRWKDHADLERDIRALRDEVERADRRVDKTMARDVKQGLDAVRRVVERHSIAGVHGPLVELITCEAVYNTAVEETAGNALLNVVVRDDTVASDILAAMNKEKMEGRVTFMPLNRLRPGGKALPRTDDVVPLAEKLQYDPLYAPAVQEVFGRTLLAASLEVAHTYSRDTNLDCITLEGDKVDRKGALTGGFRDVQVSRIAAVQGRRKAAESYEEKKRAMQQVERELQGLDQAITAAVGELQTLTTGVDALKRRINQERLDMRGMTDEDTTLQRTLADKAKGLEALEQTVKETESAIAALTGELGTQMKSQLSGTEEEELRKLTASVTDLRHQHTEAQTRLTELEAQAAVLAAKLTDNFTKREAHLADQLTAMGEAGEAADQKHLEADLAGLDAQVKDVDKQFAALNKGAETYLKAQRDLAGKIERLTAAERDLVREHQDVTQRINAYLSEKGLHQGKREEALKKIRNLGTMPADVEKYQRLDSKKLIAELHKVNAQLKAFSHVNKKALEQYTQLVESRDGLLGRKAEIDKDDESIRTLISHLDNKKDEAILRTFKQVKVEFESIFKQLVQMREDTGVSAELIMLRTEESLKRRAASQETVDMFTGVQIRVNFGGGGTQSLMDKLSGGQRSLVALALIFAIQRADPAPFYLFDEIDQALDEQYRAAVALMVKEQSANAQYLTSTFKTELVQVADRHYGIVFRNKVSRIARITEQQAVEILRLAAADVKKRRPGEGDEEMA
eukprot:EG_transcript_781